jgi:carbamoyl-phosphate synthase large subunit
LATEGTAQVLRRNDVEVEVIRKATQGVGPNGEVTIVDAILNGEVDLIFNTPQGISKDGSPRRDGWQIRSAAILADVPCVTTVQGLSACVQGIEALRKGEVSVRSLQSWNQAVQAELSKRAG